MEQAMEQAMVENMGHTKRICIRFDDKVDEARLNVKFYRPPLGSKAATESFLYEVKCLEQLTRGCSPTSVAQRKRFESFKRPRFSEGAEVNALLEGYQSFSADEKKGLVKKLVFEIFAKHATAMRNGPVQQGVDNIQADGSGTMQVGERSACQLESTVREDDYMQVSNPGQIQADDVRPAAPNPDSGNTLSNDAPLSDGACNQFDNSQGQYVPSVEAVHLFLSDVERRASWFPEKLPTIKWVEEFKSYYSKLQSLEEALVNDLNPYSKSCEAAYYPALPSSGVPQNVPSTREYVDVEVSNPGQIQAVDVREGASNPGFGNTLPNDAPSQTVTCSQFDNSRDHYVSSDLGDLLIFTDVESRASLEGASVGDSNFCPRSCEAQILLPLPSSGVPQNVPSTSEISSAEF